jgi:CubicO group peptidase (beta-lactamase class C family)
MKKTVFMLALCAAVFSIARSQNTKLSAELDKVLKEEFSLNNTGVAALVSSNGKIIYKKAIGMANAELNVPMQTDNVFRIASITKQFTSVAILQLMENGKLNLQDEITKFIPDYPVQGATITIEHLLTHTSGIRDFTSMRDTMQRSKMDFTPVQMIALFKDQPIRFSPGSKYEYSNSNYIILGYIIEKLSGKSYGQYLEDNFFKPLGMTSSFYGNDSKIIKKRAAGYTKSGEVIKNADVISMTQPYAAGAIMSTAEDLFKWHQAVQSYKLVQKETLDKAFTKFKLTNGTESNYGYGWRLGYIQGSPSIGHAGMIPGFMSMAMYLPQNDVYVVVLSNCDCVSPEMATVKLAAVAIGQPYATKEITLESSILQSYAGVYENKNGEQRVITVQNGKLYSQRGASPKAGLKAFEKNKFFFDDPMITMEFVANTNGKTEKLIIKSRTAIETWTRTDRPLLTQTEIKVDETILEMYTGEYEISPQFTFIVTRENDRLFLQATGQDKLEMFAETNHKFFLKVNDAQFEFVNESGKITKVMLKQGGRTADAVKIK